MNLRVVQPLIRSAQALAEDRIILVLGSASLHASFPDLGNPEGPLASTFAADISPEPFDELTAIMLDEALGENRAYYRIHGDHADILRDSILETLPTGWRDRLIPVPETHATFALEPHDLAAVKLPVGRPKDHALLRNLHSEALLHPGTIRERMSFLKISIERMPKLLASFRLIFGD